MLWTRGGGGVLLEVAERLGDIKTVSGGGGRRNRRRKGLLKLPAVMS